ncbi:MAG: hypothetical protein H7296_15160 [Bacteroidia bacterium]|nr:hypothetical protein [Bacteroidia bacterium]
MEPKEPVLTATLRDTLKETMQKEMEGLPGLLERLPPIERINAICKLMPFAFPKIETITATDGEPEKW